MPASHAKLPDICNALLSITTLLKEPKIHHVAMIFLQSSGTTMSSPHLGQLLPWLGDGKNARADRPGLMRPGCESRMGSPLMLVPWQGSPPHWTRQHCCFSICIAVSVFALYFWLSGAICIVILLVIFLLASSVSIEFVSSSVIRVISA